jgi:hypothetical protein
MMPMLKQKPQQAYQAEPVCDHVAKPPHTGFVHANKCRQRGFESVIIKDGADER